MSPDIPSIPTVEFLLRHVGFKSVEFYQPKKDDYEQFTRKQRVIVFATR